MTQNNTVVRDLRFLIAFIISFFLAQRVQAAEPIPLRAGPLTMVFEPDNAFLRYVNLGSHEVFRGINAPIRNQFWGTVLPEVTNVVAKNQGDHFSLEFDASCREEEIDFQWHGTIRGSAEGELELIFDGEAHSTFLRNRIGFCVLHGPSAAGRPWIVENPKGEITEGIFPTFISPHQPANDIRSITHEVTDGIWAKVQFKGDVFETEDQRNWTDASFKTYCTPLAIPYPVEVVKGSKVYQRIVIRLEGELEVPEQKSDATVLLTVGKRKSSVPDIGLQVSSEVVKLSTTQIQKLRALKLDHLRVRLTLADSDFESLLRQAAKQAESLDIPLHATLHLGEHPEEELQQLTVVLKKVRPPISVWLVNTVDDELFRLVHKSLKSVSADAQIGVSHVNNFVDLNRARPTDEQIEVVAYGINPQIHAVDNRSIVETLPIHGDTVRSAKQFFGDRRLIVGPITFRPQPLNQPPVVGELPTNVDRRQPSLFVAGWTLGSINYLAEAGAESVTYYETVGWKGIMEADEISPHRAKFPSHPGQVFAVYHVLRNLADFQGGEVIEFGSSDALSVVGLALTDGKRTRLLVANLTGKEKSVSVRGAGEDASVWKLGSRNSTANFDSKTPLVLSAFEVSCIEWAVK